MKTKKMILQKLYWLCFLLCITLPGTSQIKVLVNGNKISFDQTYYDFRDSAGIQMIKMWIPPGIKPIKGMFISGHGGGGGDSRDFARDENMRAIAMRLGFAIVGIHNFPGRSIYDKGGKVFFNALDEFAKLGHHPEIANLPFVIYGSSNGGATTYGFVNYAPDRAICFLANVSAGGNPAVPVDAALKVPGIFIMGQFDALVGQKGIDRTAEIMKHAREKGALWSWAIELKGHEDGFSFDVYMKLVEQAVAARYPKNGNPAKGKVKLIELKEESGWLADQESWSSGLVNIAPYQEYSGNKKTAGWLMNKDMAYIYRSMATHHNPLTLKVFEFDRTFNPNIDPGTMYSLGGPVAKPGDKITITCNADNFENWEKIEFFNGSVSLGEVMKGNKPEISTVLDANCQVYCLTVLATDKMGKKRTSNPMHFFISNPELSWKSTKTNPVFTGVKSNAGSKSFGKTIATQPSTSEDSLLIAYGLTPEMEKQFSANDNVISDFWKRIDENKDVIKMTAKKNGTADAAFNPVISHDCNMKVKAAYGADGIYLLFEINDDNDVAWQNEFTGTEKEQFYLNFDVVDVLIDSRSIAEISKPENNNIFVSKSFGLTSSTRQYQVACGTTKEMPSGFRRALAEPWDFNATYFRFDEAKTQLGMQIELIKTDYFYKVQEWFIPWTEVGEGFKEEPAALTRIAFSPGYNDRDEGEHFAPGVSSSGGSVKASNAIRWINRSSPWGSSKPPFNWGEIVLGEMLK